MRQWQCSYEQPGNDFSAEWSETFRINFLDQGKKDTASDQFEFLDSQRFSVRPMHNQLHYFCCVI